MSKNKSNHPISRNSHPTATTNKAINSLKRKGVQNQREHHIRYQGKKCLVVRLFRNAFNSVIQCFDTDRKVSTGKRKIPKDVCNPVSQEI